MINLIQQKERCEELIEKINFTESDKERRRKRLKYLNARLKITNLAIEANSKKLEYEYGLDDKHNETLIVSLINEEKNIAVKLIYTINKYTHKIYKYVKQIES